MYDVTRRETFESLGDIWMREVDMYSTVEDAVKMVVANKTDLVSGPVEGLFFAPLWLIRVQNVGSGAARCYKPSGWTHAHPTTRLMYECTCCPRCPLCSRTPGRLAKTTAPSLLAPMAASLWRQAPRYASGTD